MSVSDAPSSKKVHAAVYKCKKCRYFSKSILLIKNHVKHHQTNQKFNCEGSIIKPLYCHICEFSTYFVAVLKEHFREFHGTKKPNGKPKFIARIYKCPKCKLETSFYLNWHRHRKKCCGGNISLINNVEEVKETIDHRLEEEMIELNGMEEEKVKSPVVEEKNTAIFIENKNDNATNQVVIFDCNLCSYKTFKITKIRMHGRNRHSDQPEKYKCKSCGLKDRLKTVIELHKCPPKKHICKYCNCGYSRQPCLSKHISEEHKWVLLCRQCNFYTESEVELASHKVLKHSTKSKIAKNGKGAICH